MLFREGGRGVRVRCTPKFTSIFARVVRFSADTSVRTADPTSTCLAHAIRERIEGNPFFLNAFPRNAAAVGDALSNFQCPWSRHAWIISTIGPGVFCEWQPSSGAARRRTETPRANLRRVGSFVLASIAW